MSNTAQVLVWSADSSSTQHTVTADLENPNASARRFVRSHAMRGRNTRADRRARKEAQLSKNAQTSYHGEEWVVTTPRKIASELSLHRYGIEMKPYMLHLMYRAFTVVKPATYTIETQLVDQSGAQFLCLADIHGHPAMIHAVLFTTQAFHDISLGQAYGRTAMFHLAQTLQHLQNSLTDADSAIAYITMTVITTLASAAAILGDIETLEKHMNGLEQIVKVRGGLKSLQKGIMIQHKAQRLDLGLAMATGQKPRFFPKDVSWGPQLAQAGFAANIRVLSGVQWTPDPKLVNIWCDLKCFCSRANKATESGTKMHQDIFSKLSTSVPNRLVRLAYESGSFAELLRLSMLAFVKGLLVGMPGLGPKMWYLSTNLETTLQAQEVPACSSTEHTQLLFWALVVAGVTIFESFDRPWHRKATIETATALGIHSWAQARSLLRELMWVDMVYDGLAERVLEKLFSENIVRG